MLQCPFLDIIITRRALEGTAAYLAAKHATPEHVMGLSQCLAEMAEVAQGGLHREERFYAYGELDTRLHMLIAEAAGNSILETLVSSLLPLVMTGRFDVVKRLGTFDQFLNRSVLSELQVHTEHVDIVEAIGAQDPTTAERLMLYHMDRAIEVYGSLGDIGAS